MEFWKKSFFILVSLIFLGSFFYFFLSYNLNSKENYIEKKFITNNTFYSKDLNLNTTKRNEICYNERIVKVDGSSMVPRINNADKILHLVGYYNCNKIQRNDIITYNFTGNENLLLKQIKAIPGDKFEYYNDTIFINSKILKNSVNISYKISSKMLELYSKSYPILPENTYLILGDNPSGTLDSSKFGLIDKSQIIGKGILIE